MTPGPLSPFSGYYGDPSSKLLTKGVVHSHDTVRGWYKTWTLDSGLDYGLDYGLNYGLNFGLDWTVASVLALLFKADYEC